MNTLAPAHESAPPADELPRRAWAAYFRHELTDPVVALAEYTRDLAARSAEAGHAETAQTAARVRERAEQLLATVHQLSAAGPTPVDAADEREYRRTVRHDLRAAAAFVVSACEDMAEGSPPDVATVLVPVLSRSLTTARHVIDLIESVVRYGRTPEAAPPDGPAHAMLARLPAVIAGDIPTPHGLILVVDDNEYGRDLIVKALSHQGHTVEVACDGYEAQKRLSLTDRPVPDLILLDVMMPGLTGPELLRWLKADDRLWHVPVIMVSALGEDDSVLACIAAGAEDYLTRPVKSGLLRARIAGCLEKKRLRDREIEYQTRIAGLVRAIFPPAAVTEWEQTGTIRTRLHERVGVLFLDVVGFTALCEKHQDEPEEVIRSLQTQVEMYEDTARRHGVQKIKTIGDAFMGAVGLQPTVANPALTLLRCALDLIADTACHPAGWRVRVGIHVGPVVTGILGKTQFSYDIWGHTVNAAERVEATGRAGVVSLTDEAWQMLDGVAEGESRQIVARGIGVMTVWDFIAWRGGRPPE
ncbi:adenylate/guanylate cyclase domain-containing protein [Fimbriiglobus ruber]|uniref:Adenylate cyclase n=1 Tax=Fimbriiglobus ruber TaxID=1908690 RepID=A0A225CZS9_9BACT|nr:adenylate/guanylate cyclase domain-containing protein [Fimbriiglobus ruber]OWK34860.1 Adenylate cyclase [Fimbriiglobus ruber]